MHALVHVDYSNGTAIEFRVGVEMHDCTDRVCLRPSDVLYNGNARGQPAVPNPAAVHSGTASPAPPAPGAEEEDPLGGASPPVDPGHNGRAPSLVDLSAMLHGDECVQIKAAANDHWLLACAEDGTVRAVARDSAAASRFAPEPAPGRGLLLRCLDDDGPAAAAAAGTARYLQSTGDRVGCGPVDMADAAAVDAAAFLVLEAPRAGHYLLRAARAPAQLGAAFDRHGGARRATLALDTDDFAQFTFAVLAPF